MSERKSEKQSENREVSPEGLGLESYKFAFTLHY